MCLRKTPSNCAGSASSARRERSFFASVLNSTRMQPCGLERVLSWRSFASMLAPDRQRERASATSSRSRARGARGGASGSACSRSARRSARRGSRTAPRPRLRRSRARRRSIAANASGSCPRRRTSSSSPCPGRPRTGRPRAPGASGSSTTISPLEPRCQAVPHGASLSRRDEHDARDRERDAELLQPMHALVQAVAREQHGHDRIEGREDGRDAQRAVRRRCCEERVPARVEAVRSAPARAMRRRCRPRRAARRQRHPHHATPT